MARIRSAHAPGEAAHPTYYRLERLSQARDRRRLAAFPTPSRSCSRTCCGTAGGLHVRESDVEALARWPQPRPRRTRCRSSPARVMLQDFTGVPAVVDLAAMRSAMARAGVDPTRSRPARALRPRDRPLGAGRCLRQRPPPTRCNIDREYERNTRALRAAALGAGRVRQLPRRAAGHGHRAPGQPRVPGAVVVVRRGEDGTIGDARHAGRHRLAHDDDQRPGRARLGCRRHRGRGRRCSASRSCCRRPMRRGRALQRRSCAQASRPPTWC